MAEPKAKQTFGGCNVHDISPLKNTTLPPALNMVISFDDALRLHLSLGQALGKLNSYKRSTTAGRRSAINLCLYHKTSRITVNESKLKN